jgi:tRNA(Ile)-lysidine synthase
MATRCVAVAHSGGRDSTALLHAVLQQAVVEGLQVVALHVHHGLQAAADEWLQHVQRQCRRWAGRGLPVRLLHRRLEGQPARGESIEAWARRGRYRALAEMAREAQAGLVLLAHHRRDQAETVVLQALRGGGAEALAAMPRSIEREGLVWARPWLDQPREAIEAYVKRHRLRYVDDASNDDPRFARNRLRLHVWPALSQAFGDAEPALAAAARRAQQEADCLRELALQDLSGIADGQHLRVDAWRTLSPARRANALRAWMRQRSGRGAGGTLIDRLLDELPRGDGPARWPAEGGEWVRYRGRLSWSPAAGDQADPPAPSQLLRIDGPGSYALPGWGGQLLVEEVPCEGMAVGRFGQPVELRPRVGAEQFQCRPRSLPRGLKKQFQAAGVAPWLRSGPLVYCGEALVFVPGLGMDARAWAPPGEPQWRLRWIPAQGAAQYLG